MLRTISKYYFFATCVGALLLFSSCKKTLELDEIGGFNSEKAILTDADVKALINSAYFAMAADDYYGGSFQVYNELLADHIDGTTLGGNYLGMYSRNTNIFNGDNSTFYAQMYKLIYQANLTLDNLAKAEDANKAEYEGQAKFLRALALFDLVRMYAQPYVLADAANTPGIPMRLNSARQAIPRSSVAAVYQQVIADLKDAETKLQATNTVYATKWAAKALLAKVYFQMNDFQNAYTYSNDVIQNGGYVFDADIMNRYSPGGSSEIIFGLINEVNQQGRFQRLRGNFVTTGSNLPTLRLTNAFYARATSNNDDIRNEWYQQRSGANLVGKFDSNGIRLPVIHLTEIKLIRAESAGEIGQFLDVAIGDLNDIIRRAYGTTSSLILPPSANAALIIQTARRERELELVGEGNRLQELKRIAAKGEQITIRGSVYNCPGLIFPIPNNEIIYNEIPQNPTGGCN